MYSITTYNEALLRINNFMDDHHKINSFDASLLLAYIFDGSKENILEDLINLRGSMLWVSGLPTQN